MKLAAALAAFSTLLVLAAGARGQEKEAQPYAAPPRTVEDILAVLDQYKPADEAEAQRRRRAEADQEPPATDERSELAQFYLERARARGGLGQRSRQIEDLRRAAELAKGTMQGRGGSMQEDGDEARILYELSQAESGGGNFVTAMRLREEMLQRMQAQARPRPGTLLSGYGGLANMNAALGDLQAARDYLERAEKVFVQMRRLPGWTRNGEHWSAGMERVRGNVYAAQGKYAAAEAAFRKAVQFMDLGAQSNREAFRAGLRTLPPRQYLTQRNADESRLAWAMAMQGRLAEAEAAARNALKNLLTLHGRYHGTTAGALALLSRIVFEQGRYRDANALAGASVDIFVRTGVAPESLPLAGARRAYGGTLVALGQWREAIAVFDAMQDGLARDPAVLRQLGKGDLNWGYALVRTGQAKAAATMLRELLGTTRQRLGEEDRGVAELRGYLAIALAEEGDTAGALAEFRRAVPVLLDGARADQASETGGIARSMRLNNVLEAYLALLAELHRTQKAPAGLDAAAEAFRIADVARSSNVQRALAASAARASIHDPRIAGMAREEQDAQHRIGVLSDLLSRLLAAAPEQQLTKIIADMRRDLEALRKSQGELRAQIAQRVPEYASLTDPKPTTIAQAQAALRDGEALVAIYLAPTQLYAWAVPRRGAASFATAALPRERVDRTVAALRRALDVGDVPLARFPRFDLEAAHALYAEVLAPIEAGWKDATSLLIVPHGSLGQLPFALLPTQAHVLKEDAGKLFAGYREVPWLIKRVALTQLPSVSTLPILRGAPAPAAGRREFIGFGDPLFRKDQAVPAAAHLPAGAGMTRAALRDATGNSMGIGQLAPLPDTSEEILDIAKVLHADPQQDVFLHERADESLLKKLDLSKRRIVAFATHGLVPGDLNGLTEPALALSAREVVGSEDDGLLTLEEVLALKLDADWVVLSACNTGSAGGAGEEAVSGLGRAFFYAGARALLVSNWPVETVSARLLTTDLFRRQSAAPGLSRAEALRQTMLGLMQGPGSTTFSYAHPMFWAPFSLVGDGGGR